MVCGPSFVFTRKAVVDETFIWNARTICESIVGIDSSQLYPPSMCQPMPTGLHTRWEYDTESNKFKTEQNKSRNFENMVVSYFQRQRPDCQIESFYTTGTQKNIDCFKVDVFCAYCKSVGGYGLLPSILFMSRSTTFSNWRRYPRRQQKERNGPDEKAVQQRRKI